MNVLNQIHPRPALQRCDLTHRPSKGLSYGLSSVFAEGSHLFLSIQGSRKTLTNPQKASELYFSSDTLKRRNVNIPDTNYGVQPERRDQLPTLSA